ncbi:unnamed protein product [Sphagnum balticum]
MSLRWLQNPFLDPSVLLSTARLRSRPGKKTVEGYATGGRSVVDGIELETRQQSAAAGAVTGAFLELRAILDPRSCMQRFASIGTIAGHAGARQNHMLQSTCKNQPHFFQT